MKLPATFAAFALFATPALAVPPCFDTFQTGNDINVSFPDSSMVATPSVSTSCTVTTDPIVVLDSNDEDTTPSGAIYAFSSDYRVDSNGGDTVHLQTTENGVTRTYTVPGSSTDSNYFHTYVGTVKGDPLQSEIDLGVDSPDDNSAELSSLDYFFLGYTTLPEQRDSLDQVAADATAVVVHLNTTAGLIVGNNQPLERDNQVGLIGAVGSHTVGVTGHFNLSDGFSLDGGAALFEQSVGGAETSGVLLGGKASYLQPEDGSNFRLLGNVGVTAAPNMSMSFSRDYTLYGAGDNFTPVTVTSTASGNGTMVGAWIEGGVMVAPAPNTEIVFSASYARNWLDLGDVAEAQTDQNPFAFSADGTSTFDTLKVKTDWTTAITPDVDLTVHAALGQVFAGDLEGNLALVGDQRIGGQDEAFAEYGARVDWQFADNASAGAFILGSTGSESGTHLQVGSTVSMKF